MASARSLYRLQVALGALGVAATVFALVVALSRVEFRLASIDAIGAACRQMGLADFSAPSLLVLLLGSFAVAVTGLAARSCFTQLRSRRRFLGQLAVSRTVALAGHHARVVDDPRPLAFCTGLLRPRIYISRGALALLGADELDAVIAHEAHHARRRDPLRLFIAGALGEALFFLPVLRRLSERYAALAELAADEAAVRRSGKRQPLAAALLAFEDAPSAAVVGIAPERVDHLLGNRPRWELPTALLAGAAVTLAGLFLAVARTADATASASVDLPVLLAQACMVTMAVVPLFAGAAVLLMSRRVLGRRRG
jgi:Zn-dependent protease with chaperone function